MLDPAQKRLLMRAFSSLLIRAVSVFWYGFCGAAILFGLFLLFLGLAGLLNLEPFGMKIAPGAGLGFLVGSAFAMGMAIACLFAGRYLRSVLSLLDPHAKKSDEKQFEFLYSGQSEEAASKRSSTTAAETEKAAKRSGRLFWIFISICLAWVLVGSLTSFVWTYWHATPLRKVADEFITALETGSYERAYELCDPLLQDELNNEKRIGQLLYLSRKPDPGTPGHHQPGKPYHPRIWTTANYRGDTAWLSAGRSGGGSFARVRFKKVGDHWRISRFVSSTDTDRQLWIHTNVKEGDRREVGGQPDLQVVQVFLNENGEVTARIRNSGTARAARARVRFTRDEKHVSIYHSRNRLQPGEEWQVSGGRLPQGSHTVKVIVEPDNEIVESDESNNSKEATLSWPPSEPVAEQVADPR